MPTSGALFKDSHGQSLMVLSSLPERMYLPSGEKATENTPPLCPSKRLSSLPVAASQSLMVLSSLTREDISAVRGEGDGIYRAAMPLETPQFLAGRCLPEPDGLVIASREDVSAVRGEGDGAYMRRYAPRNA